MQIEEPRQYRIALLHLGFRPFFLFGSIFAIVFIGLWLWILRDQYSPANIRILGNISWHAHEMIFGYTIAIIAGFLLTAERNWTGVQTLHGFPLLLLGLLWTLARLMPFIPIPQAIVFMAVLDLTFNIVLCLALLHPIAKTRQWQHLLIWFMLLLITASNLIFYLDVFGYFSDGRRLGIYSALYIIVTLIMLMGRRVIPFFIERGVASPVILVNRPWLDRLSPVLMLFFIIDEVFLEANILASIVAASLAVLHIIRLSGWYTHGIWQKPLLWVLYLGYGWLIIGLVLKFLSYWLPVNPMLSVHAFTFGGIGMITLGMMARITLGHTGRDVANPPRWISALFLLLLAGAIVRVLLPLVLTSHYNLWITVSQWLWMIAFGGFIVLYAPMLVKGRIDGRYG